jgi:ribosomal protein S27E
MEAGEPRDPHYVKRVVLPSGKTIEVVYFKDASEQDSSFRTVAEPDQALHVCAPCGSELVYPTGWEETDHENWQVRLRCPECEHRREGVFSSATVEVFEEVLDKGTDALTADHRRLYRANMAEEARRFTAALRSDAILPEDF